MSILFSRDGDSLRRRVIHELRDSGPQWQDYRRRRRPWWRRDIPTQRFLLLLLVLGPVAAAELSDAASPDSGPRPLSAILISLVCGRAFTLAVETWNALYNNAEFGVTAYLPVRPDAYFRYQIRKIVFRSLWVPVLAVLIYAVFVAVFARGGRATLLVLPVAALYWLVFFALSLFIVRYGRRYLGLNNLPGYAFYTIAFLIARSNAAETHEQFNHISAFLPPAWIDAGFRFAVGGDRSLALLFFLPAIALASSAAWNYAWLKTTFLDAVQTALPRFPSTPESAESNDAPASAAEDRTDWIRARAELQGMQTAQSIGSGALAVRVDWASRGPIERCAALWFTERERTVAEFLLGAHIGWWSQRWKQSAVVAAVVVAGALGGFFTPLVLVLGGVLSMLIGCPVVGGYWIAFGAVRVGGLNIPMIAAFPAGYREVSGVILKSGVLRLAAWLPLGLLIGIASGHVMRDAETGAAMAAYLVYIALAFQPMAAAIRFAEGVNDSMGLAIRSGGLRRSMCSFFTIAIGAAFMATSLVVVSLVPTTADLVRVAFAMTLPLLSLLFWRLYAFLLHHGHIDQLTVPRR